ncbi:hypothetical protein FDX01_05835 [Citrobacter sp. wls613]|nr:hypothetical protein FDX01_05835 [Citrobacter sp. wls613]
MPKEIVFQIISKSSCIVIIPCSRKSLCPLVKKIQTNRNYLVKCTCPSCSKDSEHSFSRVQKGSQLVCPFCSTLFKSLK